MSGSSSRVVGSVLDRLLDHDNADRGLSLRELHASVRRDLEALLNARRPWASLPAALQGSMLGYGLPDYASGAFNAAAQREALCREIATTIRRFEPRLTQVSVKTRDRPDNMEPLLRIRIEALLVADGADEPIGFDTLLDATTTDMQVRTGANV